MGMAFIAPDLARLRRCENPAMNPRLSGSCQRGGKARIRLVTKHWTVNRERAISASAAREKS